MAGPVASRIRHLRLTLGLSGVVLLVGTLIGGVAGGWAGALGVAAGVALVAASYTVSTLAIAWADSVAPRLVFPVGMGVYLIKVCLFGGMLLAIMEAGWAGRIPMAIGIVVGVIAWTASQIWWTLKRAHPYASPPPEAG